MDYNFEAKKSLIALVPDNIGSMGGTRTFLFKILHLHNKYKLSTTLVIQKNQLDEKIEQFCCISNIPILIVPNRLNLFKKNYLSIIYDIYIFFLIKVKVSPSLIIASIGTPRLFLSFLFFKTKLIYYLHTIPCKGSKKGSLINLISYFFTHEKKIFATVSNFSKNAINKYMHVNSKNIYVIYNSFDHRGIKKTPNHNKNVLTVGHVVWYKNISVWLSVAKQVIAIDPNVNFYWVGEGPLLNEIRLQLDSENLSKNIKLVGFHENVKPFYDKSDIYFQPSLIESHGISVIDAMAYGLPCITSNVGGMPESVVDGETGFLCDPENISDFVTKILLLLNNKSLSESMGKKGQKKALQLFSQEAQEQKILGLYRKLGIV